MNEKSELPYEYGFARIGSTMNYLTRDFTPLRHAFDMSKLNALGMLVTRQPKGELTIDANSFTSSNQDSSSFSTSSKVRAGFPFFKSSIEHHNTHSGAKLNTASGLSLKVRHSLIGYDIVLNDDITPEQLYACATPNFKAAYNKIVETLDILGTLETKGETPEALKILNDLKAKDQKQWRNVLDALEVLVTLDPAETTEVTEAREILDKAGLLDWEKDLVVWYKALMEWQEAYFDFQAEFGHGFITKLKLISTASGELHVSYESEVEQDQKKYGEGASVTIGKPRKSVGASNAQDWAKAHSNSESKGTVSAQVESIPGISSVANWANAFISEYAGKGIDSITKKPPTSISAPTADAKAPEIPSLDPPKVTKEDLPTPSITLDSTEKVLEFMQMKEMKNNKDHENDTWDKFSKKFNKDTEDAKPEKIVEEVHKEKIEEDNVEDKKIKSTLR